MTALLISTLSFIVKYPAIVIAQETLFSNEWIKLEFKREIWAREIDLQVYCIYLQVKFDISQDMCQRF